MMKKSTKILLFAVIFTVITIAFTVAVRFVNVLDIGPAGTSVGFGKINGVIALALGSDEYGFTYSEKLYNLTDKLGYAAFAWIGVFGVMGLVQLIRRKSLLKVDPEILAVGILYVLTAIVYVLFEKITVNCRPVLMPGETVPEASFPSTHTMLALVLWISAAVVLRRYIKKRGLWMFIAILFSAIACAVVFMRALSGVHWATDIIGGILFGAMLLYWFTYVLFILRKKHAAVMRAR